jgi:hypothetical protein
VEESVRLKGNSQGAEFLDAFQEMDEELLAVARLMAATATTRSFAPSSSSCSTS